jgi:phosphoserine phosphatase
MSAPQTPPRTAAFVRVEGLLLPPQDLLQGLYVAAQAPGQGQRLGRWGAMAASLPALGLLAWRDRRRARRLASYQVRGLSADRVELLAEELAAKFAERELRQAGLDVLERARKGGHRLVLVTAGLAAGLEPLRERLGAQALVGARFELREGRATGRLIEPWEVEAPADLAARLGVELAGSYGYGTDALDLPLLRAVGFPCAADPDARLRREAEAEGWPVLEGSLLTGLAR